ncbi:Uncharacterised protein [Burkholderia pseudomallei]|nr:Uncharacterised protein [Burkholderia pseudomallei]
MASRIPHPGPPENGGHSHRTHREYPPIHQGKALHRSPRHYRPKIQSCFFPDHVLLRHYSHLILSTLFISLILGQQYPFQISRKANTDRDIFRDVNSYLKWQVSRPLGSPKPYPSGMVKADPQMSKKPPSERTAISPANLDTRPLTCTGAKALLATTGDTRFNPRIDLVFKPTYAMCRKTDTLWESRVVARRSFVLPVIQRRVSDLPWNFRTS